MMRGISMRIVSFSLVVLMVTPSVSNASFVRFADCVQECTGGYWRRVAWTLDCELELAACVVTLGGRLAAYTVGPDPKCLAVEATNANFPPGSSIPFTLDVLRITPGFTFGASASVNDQGGYEAFRNDNLFTDPTNITLVEVKALRLTGPGMLPDDAGLAILDPIWDSAPVLYSGPNSGNMQLDTNALEAGRHVLRTRVVDALANPPGDQFGLSSLTLDVDPIPTVSEWGLIILTLLMLTAGVIVIRRARRGHEAA